MKILALDHDIFALKSLTKAIRDAEPKAEVLPFRSSKEALEYVKENVCDVVCLDVELSDGDGMAVAGEMAYYNDKINIIFTVKTGAYAEKAFAHHASGYIRKPVTSASMKAELSSLRYKPAVSGGSSLRISTFGNFEVYYNDEPMKLRAKSKELLAYLVDRSGALISNNEIYGVLFEDEPGHEENLKKVKKNLVDSFRNLGLDNVIIVARGHLGVNPDSFDCDLYAWRRGNSYARNSYFGEYMSQYSWAEYSKGEFFDDAE